MDVSPRLTAIDPLPVKIRTLTDTYTLGNVAHCSNAVSAKQKHMCVLTVQHISTVGCGFSQRGQTKAESEKGLTILEISEKDRVSFANIIQTILLGDFCWCQIIRLKKCPINISPTETRFVTSLAGNVRCFSLTYQT